MASCSVRLRIYEAGDPCRFHVASLLQSSLPLRSLVRYLRQLRMTIASALRGIAYVEIHKDDLAISDLTRAAQIATKHNAHDGTDNIYVMRCMAYGDKGQYQKAIADCDEALRINPKSTDAADLRKKGPRQNGDR